MTAAAPATLVWISENPPDATATESLTAWARAHDVELTPPANEPLPAMTVDLHVADEVENLLDRARDAITARETDTADHAIASAEALLRAHPELPQAAWLMAEVDRTRSARYRRIPPVDPQAAERAWVQAEALDGGRVAGIGELNATSHAPSAALVLELPDDDRALLDGTPVHAESESRGRSQTKITRAGPHALVVIAEDSPVWAEWIDVSADGSTLVVDAPTVTPCSAVDMRRATLSVEHVEAERVRCEHWVAATRGDQHGRVRVARCSMAACGPWIDWPAVQRWAWTPSNEPGAEMPSASGARWPAWATWTLVGVGAAVAAGVGGIVASGALKSPSPETRFVSGGLKTE